SKIEKVGRLGNYIAEKTSYHHGEKSLIMAIVNMAQDFVGTNNMPYFTRNGMFGDRNNQKASSERYISCGLEWWTKYVFKEDDIPLYELIEDEGVITEPKTLYPILPLQLINGSLGIGTGWSCWIPSYNPID